MGLGRRSGRGLVRGREKAVSNVVRWYLDSNECMAVDVDQQTAGPSCEGVLEVCH